MGMWRLGGSLVMIAALALVVPACSSPYVNIPAQSGDVASANPNTQAVREVQIQALATVIERENLPGPVRIELPRGSDGLTYAAVASRLGEAVVTPADDDVEAATVLVVEQIRIRGWDAQVDVLKPATGNVQQVVTVYLRNAPTAGWTVERTRTWRGPATASERVRSEDL